MDSIIVNAVVTIIISTRNADEHELKHTAYVSVRLDPFMYQPD